MCPGTFAMSLVCCVKRKPLKSHRLSIIFNDRTLFARAEIRRRDFTRP